MRDAVRHRLHDNSTTMMGDEADDGVKTPAKQRMGDDTTMKVVLGSWRKGFDATVSDVGLVWRLAGCVASVLGGAPLLSRAAQNDGAPTSTSARSWRFV